MCVYVYVYVCVCGGGGGGARARARAPVNQSLTLHNVQTRGKFPCMLLAWTINGLILIVNS